MTYRDQWATNEDGSKFIFTVEMQRRLEDEGLPVDPASVSQLPALSSPQSSAPPPRRDNPRQSEREPDFEEPMTIQIDPQTGKYIGRMKWYNVKKGYGFLVRGGGEEIFFHKSSTVGEPESFDEGQWVLYDVEETRKGPEATEIEPYAGDTSELS